MVVDGGRRRDPRPLGQSGVGRRVADIDDLEYAGDYCLTWVNGHKDPPHRRRHVWFLLPIHEGETIYERPTRGSGLHGVSEPPWTFRECSDGSIEIRASIACGRHDKGPDGVLLGEYWHGWLSCGHRWHTA